VLRPPRLSTTGRLSNPTNHRRHRLLRQCRPPRFLQTDIGEIRIFSRDEKKQDDMRKRYHSVQAEVLHRRRARPASVMHAMRGVDFVFHAAALKQVPSCEFHPMQAVKHQCAGHRERAPRRRSSAGVKRMMVPEHRQGGVPDQRHGHLQGDDGEGDGGQVAQCGGTGKTVICGTRYGNVMASRGSVIPLFVEQVNGGQADHHHRPGA
jgi:UDP-N-acetylglucosamine 4,6-dehydratase